MIGFQPVTKPTPPSKNDPPHSAEGKEGGNPAKSPRQDVLQDTTSTAPTNRTSGQDASGKHQDNNLLSKPYDEKLKHRVASPTVKNAEEKEAGSLDTGSKNEGRNYKMPVEAFPDKLYRILEEAESEGNSDVISFFPHGGGFTMNDQAKFVQELMPRYFNTNRLSSFQRQLNLYGFQRIKKGPGKGGYHHDLFVKGRKDLLDKIVRKTPTPRNLLHQLFPGPGPGAPVNPALATMHPAPGPSLEQLLLLQRNLRAPLRPQMHFGIPPGAATHGFSGLELGMGMPPSSMPANFASHPRPTAESLMLGSLRGDQPAIASSSNYETRIEDTLARLQYQRLQEEDHLRRMMGKY